MYHMVLLAYVNVLYRQRLGHQMIMNYVSVLKQRMKQLRVPCGSWESDNIEAFIKAIGKKPTGTVPPRAVLSVEKFETLFHVNACFPDSVPYVISFSLGLLAFFHVTNLVPSSEGKFDP